MWYVKNLPAWERALRIGAACLMALCAWHFRDTVAAWGFGIAAASSALTAVVGYCPMCALAGRRSLHPRGAQLK